MSQSRQISVPKAEVSHIAIIVLAVIFAVGLYVVGFDQGQILSIAFGEQAFDDSVIHEFTHDMRHAMGFPCH